VSTISFHCPGLLLVLWYSEFVYWYSEGYLWTSCTSGCFGISVLNICSATPLPHLFSLSHAAHLCRNKFPNLTLSPQRPYICPRWFRILAEIMWGTCSPAPTYRSGHWLLVSDSMDLQLCRSIFNDFRKIYYMVLKPSSIVI